MSEAHEPPEPLPSRPKLDEGAADSKRGMPAPSGSSAPSAPSSNGDVAGQRNNPEKAPAVDASADPGPSAPKRDTSLLKGNPLRLARGGSTLLVGSAIAFLLMAHQGQLRWGVPLGLVGVLIAAWGLMDALGTFDDPEERVANRTTLARMSRPLTHTLVSGTAFSVALMGGQWGAGPQLLWGAAVTVSFLFFVAGVFSVGVALGPWAHDEAGTERPLFARHGFWVLAAGAVLYFPMMGSFSLWDPWETHYGEVAREILARDDWISLWWAQDGWFWSKPILNFWMQSLAMASLGTHYKSDQMLIGAGGAPVAHPEWVVRAPNVLLTLLAMYFLYKGVAKVFGRRAGLLGAAVLATMPDWFFLAHQTMTDMPFVAAMTAAMGLLVLGLHTEESTLARVYEVKAGRFSWRLSAWHLVFGAVLVCAIPQILYLLSRNLELVLSGSPKGFRPHWDEFRSGSAMNCGLPGNEACRAATSASIPKSVGANPGTFGGQLARTFGAFEPFVQGILWSVVLGTLLYINWGERRVRRLLYIAAWFFAAIATMGKGPAGFGLPILCAFAYVCTKKRWSELTRLEILSGLLVILAVAIPWYVAMYVRHGSPFTDRLIFHDMYNRAFGHVHDTNEGDDTSFRFYVWQLGYALFPWTGLAAVGLTWWLRRGDSADRGRGDVSVFLVMWFLFAFALFSFMGTKFHHYIFPAVPPIAMLVGVVLDDMLGGMRLATVDGRGHAEAATSSKAVFAAAAFGGAALAVAGLTRFWPGSVWGTKEQGTLADPSVPTAVVLTALGAATLGIALSRSIEPRAKGPSPLASPAERRAWHEQLMLGGAAVSAALVGLLSAKDLATKGHGSEAPGAIRLLQLFTYNYRRAWPDALDFSAVLTAFAIVGAVLGIALAAPRIRRAAVGVFVAFAFVWAVWGIDVYMIRTAPHWGQHEVIEAYYRNRTGPNEPLVAYQMNWKGENFYTSNHVPAFVSSGANFTNWLKAEREKGVKVMFFVTEHSRIGGLRGEVGAKGYKEITDKELCNKFVLVRAEF